MQDPPPAPRPRTPFDDTLRAFEDHMARARLAARSVSAGGASCLWADALGLELPCTGDDIKRAFRRLAFKTHPDRPGGSHAAFLAAQAAAQEALDALEQATVARRPAQHPYATEPAHMAHRPIGCAVLAYA